MIATTALLTSCAPMPEADDEGHATFARDAIKLLLGRPARGADEVEVVADIAKLLGRDVAAKMLMKETEFIDTWADNLVDILQVQREFGSGLAAQSQACWGPPTRPNPDPAIATWVRDHGPNDGGAPPAWNMTDLLRSAIAIDDLSPLYRANLFTLAMRRGGFDSREEVTTRFMRTYLNRDLTCLRCHNPTFSASNKTDAGGDIVWRRTWTIPGHPEKALFGNYFDAATALNGLRQVMRGDVRKPAGGLFGIRPWGIAEACATDSFNSGPNPVPASHEGFQILGGPNPGAKFGSLDGAGGPASIFELEAALRAGIADLKDGYARLPPGNPILPPDQKQYCDVVQLFSSKCVGCHSPPNPPGTLDLSSSDPASQLIGVNTNAMPQPPNHAKRVIPSDAAHSELWRRIDQGIMPPGNPLPPADRPPVQNWIAAGAPHTADTSPCNTSTIPEVHPNEALAFLTATNVVDGIWAAAMGYRLTIDNTFPRNSEQRDMLWNLTEFEFLPKSWSLKAVLTKILASNWYARRAPAISQDDTAYGLPPIINPWIIADPTQVPNPPAHQRYNGQGELVDRARVNTLLRSIAAALAWKQPRRFPDFAYPSPLDENLGQYISPQTPGFRGVTFQSLLALESQVGLCNKTGRAVGARDWIDELVDGIDGIIAYNTANAGAPITFGEAWSMLKDRLVQDPSINTLLPSGLATVPGAKTEQQAVVAFLNKNLAIPGGITLNTSTSAATADQLKSKLREGCGIIVKSPQFVLTNITPRSYSDNNMPGPPRLNVCMPGETCGYAQACGHWRQTLHAMGHDIACADRSVHKSLWFFFPVLDLNLISGVDSRLLLQQRLALTRQSATGGAQIDLSRARTAATGEERLILQPGTEAVPLRPGSPVGPIGPLPGLQGIPVRPPIAVPPISTPLQPLQPLQPVTPIAPVAPELKLAEFDLIKNVKAMGLAEPPKGLSRVHQRVTTLCPGGICGFVARAASDIERCVRNPRENTCRGLQPLCDPRVQSGPASCGGLPADFSESGVLAAWAEGAEVKQSANTRILRQDDGQWRSLVQGTKLQAGDLIFLPPTGSLRLQIDNVVFGDTRIDDAGTSRGHLVAIVGPSSEKLLALAPKRGALSIDQMTAGVQAGRFESQALAREHLGRAIGYAVKPQHKRTPTTREIMEINADFDNLHRGLPRGAVPKKPN